MSSNYMCFMEAENETNERNTGKLDVATGRALLECDFDKNPTKLMKKIIGRDWKGAQGLIAGREAPSDESSPSQISLMLGLHVNPREEATTWVVRWEDSREIRWRVLPIHASMTHGAPLELIKDIIHHHPNGVFCEDDQGNLPLHVAYMYGRSESILQLLLEKNPDAYNKKNKKGRRPQDCAAQSPVPNRGMVFITKMAAAEANVYAEAKRALLTKQHEKELHSFSESLDLKTAELEDAKSDAETRISSVAAKHEVELQKLVDQHHYMVLGLKGEVEKFQRDAQKAYEEKCKECEKLIAEKESLEKNTFELEKNALELEKNTILLEKKALALKKEAIAQGLLMEDGKMIKGNRGILSPMKSDTRSSTTKSVEKKTDGVVKKRTPVASSKQLQAKSSGTEAITDENNAMFPSMGLESYNI
uniref:Uncharacterized protein n=1 Tax=Attheya septentrionalis TaxID=420275 RepID=A0A7S2UFT8_9STRA|mmetsp:Transcript_23728/g.42812  ORF Transcript_23728/g.42812 Transcript_23728/m.42812 type:complete len:419 (+) Transcript_23728:150-1406(+)|eukprot:CAMPEP_0198287736 /NCGR_PEP_ID=MMETSP1449-20131203/6438_1 /TAXON_ID=420275 /ORGANISM="Attheya septentrionalis, Strain CCMP2084" /LENGTH=418 /DNA_ID=CAMNT_0043985739 /DNA_START=122 /DNA_END=1378 /DNA_ORIENTATION=+